MNVFGKILVWLLIPAAIAGIVLSARVIEERNKWTKQVAALQSANESLAASLESKRKELNDLQSEFNLVVLSWDRYWNDIPTSLSPATPNSVIARELGKNLGLDKAPNAEAPLLNAFQPVGDGTYRYVGPFRAGAIQDVQTELTATWRPRPGETDTWRAVDSRWRWRGLIPSPNTERFIDRQNALIYADQTLSEREKHLAIQTKLYEAAQSRLKGRLQELGVDEGQPATAGLAGAIAAEEQARNAEWLELDRLRHALSNEIKRRDVLTAENNMLRKGLPGADESESQPRSDVAVKIQPTSTPGDVSKP
ncbi:MAG: hypothetical protein WD648_08960 [Planctomycetaceae bacterium]